MKDRKRRKDSAWGIHSDFHAKPGLGVMGEHLREEDIREICRTLKPDYWQIDCKGHYGWASYPSECGNGMPEFACDPLEVWRRVTKEEGVALYMHYSGLWDNHYCDAHPEDRVMNAQGSIEMMPNEAMATPAYVRPDSKYVDELLIPQLMELAGKYGVDGVWMDGECWAVRLDYHEETLKKFEEETGIDLEGELPVEGHRYYQEYKEFHRELFRKYVRHYTDTLHEKYPDFQICSNWMYSQTSPEEKTINLDFLSGDLDGQNSVNGGRYCARALAQHGCTWDLMSWGDRGFNRGHFDYLPKHPTQLIQEAAEVISLGGGYQQIAMLEADGSPDMPKLRRLVPVMEFVRARQKYCFRGEFVHQAALFESCYDLYHESGVIFGSGNNSSKAGLTALLCDCGQSLEIISEHILREKASQYEMIVVPEVRSEYPEEAIRELLAYAKEGGNLLLVGTKTCRVFAKAGAPYRVRTVRDKDALPIHRMCEVNDPGVQRYFTLNGRESGCVFTPSEILTENGKVIATAYYSNFSEVHHPLAVIMDYGKGKIAAIGADIGTEYLTDAQYLHRTLIRTIADRLYMPIAHIESVLGILELVCLKKNGRLMLQMINMNGSHRDASVATDDMIPPVVDIELSIACASRPEKLLFQPDGKELSFEYRDGRAYVKIDRLDIQNIIEVVE